MISVPLPAPDTVPPTASIGRPFATESLPVAARLIAAERQPVIAAYCELARAAGAIADDPRLPAAEKIRRLDAVDAVLSGCTRSVATDTAQVMAAQLRSACAALGVAIEHARHFVQACHADALNRPCRSWSDLLAYCRFAAAPAGRFLLDIHGESRAAWPAAEALCAALLILHRLRYCQTDWHDLRRIYIPRDWLDEAGVPLEALAAREATAALRRVLDRVLDGVDRLHDAARPLPRLVSDRGLRMHVVAAAAISRRLARRLRRRDPLAGFMRVSKFEKHLALAYGVVRGWR